MSTGDLGAGGKAGAASESTIARHNAGAKIADSAVVGVTAAAAENRAESKSLNDTSSSDTSSSSEAVEGLIAGGTAAGGVEVEVEERVIVEKKSDSLTIGVVSEGRLRTSIAVKSTTTG